MGDQTYHAGGTPALALLKRGAIVVLVSKASGRSLRIRDTIVEGVGGDGAMAQFLVHVRRPGVVALQNMHCPERWLHVRDGYTNGKGLGGDFCEFSVDDQGGYVSFQSCKHPGQHVGILPNGSVKPPHQTGTGEHGRFWVKPIDEPSTLMCSARPCPQGSPSAIFAHGNIICLESKASRRNLRLLGDVLNGNGGTGNPARWIVQVFAHKTIALRNFEQPNKWMRIHNGHMDAQGGGGGWCRLKYEEYDSGHVVLGSVSFPGQHVGVRPDGSTKPANQTGKGEHARFRPLLMGHQPRYTRAGDTPLLRTLTHGNVVRLYSNASKKTLRIRENGTVDGEGGEGPWAIFEVHVRSPGQVALQNPTNSKWLTIRDGQLLSNGDGISAFCTFLVGESGGHLVFESLAERGSRVGILPNGSAKQPSQTGTGPHGQFWPKIKQPSPFLTYVAGLDPVRSGLVDGHVVVLQSRANGQSLRISHDHVEAAGGRGEWAQFIVHVRGPGIVSFENVGFRSKWLAVNNDRLVVGQGGLYTHFVVKEIAGRYVALESHVYRSHHIGVLPNGALKPPSQTRTGEHGQFTLFPM